MLPSQVLRTFCVLNSIDRSILSCRLKWYKCFVLPSLVIRASCATSTGDTNILCCRFKRREYSALPSHMIRTSSFCAAISSETGIFCSHINWHGHALLSSKMIQISCATSLSLLWNYPTWYEHLSLPCHFIRWSLGTVSSETSILCCCLKWYKYLVQSSQEFYSNI